MATKKKTTTKKKPTIKKKTVKTYKPRIIGLDIEHQIVKRLKKNPDKPIINGNALTQTIFGTSPTTHQKKRVLEIFDLMQRRNWVPKKFKLQF